MASIRDGSDFSKSREGKRKGRSGSGRLPNNLDFLSAQRVRICLVVQKEDIMKVCVYLTRMLMTLALPIAILYLSSATARAADHGDAPNVAGDQACDLADVYFFLDPNNNNKVVLIGTLHGFIVPGEAVNFGIFDPNVRYRFEIESTGDARRDAYIDISFDKRAADPGPSPRQILQVPRAQTARVRLPNGETF